MPHRAISYSSDASAMLHGSPTRHVRFKRLAGMLTEFIIQNLRMRQSDFATAAVRGPGATSWPAGDSGPRSDLRA